MKRARMVAAVWDWLPAFRAIAETEHLPSAAKMVGVTPPALSRTLRVLEAQLEVELFRRVGRRLELSEQGAELLSAVRDAMRLVHDSLDRIQERESVGPVLMAASGLAKPYVSAGITKMVARYPGLEPRLRSVPTGEMQADLLSGRLDVAFLTEPLAGDDIVAHHLVTEPSSVFCGASHPLATKPNVGLDDVVAYGFAAPTTGEDGRSRDGWPHRPERSVTVRVEDMSAAVHLCRSGAALTVLPNIAARVWQGLHRLPVDITRSTELFAVRRRPLAEARDRAGLCIELVSEAIDELNA